MADLRADKDSTWIAPVFVPHAGCSHRCVFCNQHLISRTASAPTPSEVRSRLDCFFRASRCGPGVRRQIAFYGGSFTGMSTDMQCDYLEVAREYLEEGRIDSVRVSARPDELDGERLDLLESFGVRTVEVGVQSLSDRVLRASRRGTTAGQAMEAIRSVKGRGWEVGAQIMVGLPEDSGAQAMDTVERLCGICPDFVRIYPLLVLPGTDLARSFLEGRYRPLDLDDAVGICADMLDRFEQASIPVIRIGLHFEDGIEGTDGTVLAGPRHPAFGFLVRSFSYRKKLLRAADPCSGSIAGAGIRFRIHPHDRPLFSGYRRETVRYLDARFGAGNILVHEDATVPRGAVEVEH